MEAEICKESFNQGLPAQSFSNDTHSGTLTFPAEFALYTEIANWPFAANSAKMQTGARQ